MHKFSENLLLSSACCGMISASNAHIVDYVEGVVMKQLFRMREDVTVGETGEAFTVYGVEVVNAGGEVLAGYPDVFWDREKAAAFVAWCNDNDVEPVLLPDLVADAIQEQYMV